MKTHFLLTPLAAVVTCWGALAQGVQNQDIFFMGGAAFTSSTAIPGSNVTVNGKTAFADAIGYGYQLARISAASLWLEITPGTFVTGALTKATIPGTVNNDVMAYTAAARLMAPLQSRVSVYGTLGGGGGSFQYAVIEGPSNPYVTSNSTWHGLFLAGGGVDLRLTLRISVRAEVRDLITGAGLSGVRGRNHVLPLFGIAFHF